MDLGSLSDDVTHATAIAQAPVLLEDEGLSAFEGQFVDSDHEVDRGLGKGSLGYGCEDALSVIARLRAGNCRDACPPAYAACGLAPAISGDEARLPLHMPRILSD